MKRATWALTLALLFLTAGQAEARFDAPVDVPLSFFQDQLATDNVKSVDVEKDLLVGELNAPQPRANNSITTFRTALPEGTTSQWTLTQWLIANRHNAVVNVRNQNSLVLNSLVPLIPWLLIFGFMWFFMLRQL